MTREEVVQSALKVERWCREHRRVGNVCDCPFSDGKPCWFFIGDMPEFPCRWGLEEFLRTRGLKHDD